MNLRRVTLFTLIALALMSHGCSRDIPVYRFKEGINLSNYHLVDGPLEIGDLSFDVSGMAYNSDNNSLYLSGNDPSRIVQVSLKGEILKITELHGFKEINAITHTAGNVFALCETLRYICIVNVKKDQQTIRRDRTLTIGIPMNEVEKERAKSFFPKNPSKAYLKNLFVVNRNRPITVFYISASYASLMGSDVSTLWYGEHRPLFGLDQYASLAAVFGGKHFVLLNDHEKRLEERKENGELVGTLELGASNPELDAGIQRPVYLAVNPENKWIYLLERPFRLYVFAPEKVKESSLRP